MDQQHCRATRLPTATFAAHFFGSTRIAAARVPTEPTGAELDTCEERLELTAMRDRCTVRVRRGRS